MSELESMSDTDFRVLGSAESAEECRAGNTEPPGKRGSKRRKCAESAESAEGPRAKKEVTNPGYWWVFTWNNYPVDWKDYFLDRKNLIEKIHVGVETAPSTGTPHLQGWCKLTERQRARTWLDLPRAIHWETMRSTERKNTRYCGKENTALCWGLTLCRPRKELNLDLYPWEETLMTLLEPEPDDRSILWFFSREGNAGKTVFTKWYDRKYPGTLFLEGKGNDIKNGVLDYIHKKGGAPRVVIWDCPRYDREYMNYGALEKVKNMCFYSGKYEGGQVNEDCPHVVVFANDQPDYGKLSKDRWVVYEIHEDKTCTKVELF